MALPSALVLGRRILLGLVLALAPAPALAGGSAIGGAAASMMAADIDPSMMTMHTRWSPLQPGQATIHLQSPPMPLDSLVMLMYSLEASPWSRAGMRRVKLSRAESNPDLLVLDAVFDLPRGQAPTRGMDTARVVGALEALAGVLSNSPERMTLQRIDLRQDSVQVDLVGQDAHVARQALDRIEAAAAFDHVRPVRLQAGDDALTVRLKAGLILEQAVAEAE